MHHSSLRKRGCVLKSALETLSLGAFLEPCRKMPLPTATTPKVPSPSSSSSPKPVSVWCQPRQLALLTLHDALPASGAVVWLREWQQISRWFCEHWVEKRQDIPIGFQYHFKTGKPRLTQIFSLTV